MSEKTTQQDEVITPEQPTNPLMARVRIPGETFTLPSQGLFYKNGELDESCKDGEVYIFPMVTFDEILFKTPDKLFSGEAIVDVFSRCIPSIKKPMELLAKDVDYLLVCLRKLTYGETMDIVHTHDCEDAKENTYGIPIAPFIANSNKIDPTTITKTFTIKVGDFTVHLSPPRFQSVVRMYQAVMDQEKFENDIGLLSHEVEDTVVGMISAVDDITDKEHIREWVSSISAGWIHQITDAVSTVSDWGPDFDSDITCKDCGKKTTVTTPVNPLAVFI